MPKFLELLASLTPAGRAALPMLRALATTTKSATQILREVSAAGFGLRRQTGLDIIGTLRGTVDLPRLLRLTPLNQTLDPTAYRMSLTRLLRNYSYNVLVRTHDSLTGETINRFITVSTNKALSKEEILAESESVLLSGRYGERLSLDDIEVVDALRSQSLIG